MCKLKMNFLDKKRVKYFLWVISYFINSESKLFFSEYQPCVYVLLLPTPNDCNINVLYPSRIFFPPYHKKDHQICYKIIFLNLLISICIFVYRIAMKAIKMHKTQLIKVTETCCLSNMRTNLSYLPKAHFESGKALFCCAANLTMATSNRHKDH